MPQNNKIKIRRGLDVDLPLPNTEEGELRYSKDTQKLYIDDGINNVYIGGNTDNFPISTATQTALNLKANDSDVIHKTGDEIISLGTKTFNISQPIVGAQFNISATANGASAVAINNMNNGNAFYVDNKGGTAITVDLKNNSRGILMSDYSGGGQTNELFTAVKGSNTVYQLNSEGQVLGKSFVKFSAPTTNILLAGGGDLAQNTAFNKNFGLNSGDVVGATTLLNQYSAIPTDWVAQTYTLGSVVFYAGKQWIAKMATVAGDVPEVSQKWEEITFESLANKTITVDAIPTGGSNNAVSSNGVFDALATKAPISSVHNPVTIGNANGLSLATQQLSLGLASSGVTGALSGTDWNTFNNKQNALAIVSDAEMQTGTENTKFTTALRIASWFTWIKTQAQTWVAKQTFTLAPRFSSTTASQFLKVDSNKDLVSTSEASNAEMQAGTDNTKPTTALGIKNWFTWRLTQPFTFGNLAGIGNRVVQVNSSGDTSAPYNIQDGFTTDSDVITALTGATYNSGNNYTATITPANSKVFNQGQFYKNAGVLYFATADNQVSRITLS
jgi:hypothetical protein